MKIIELANGDLRLALDGTEDSDEMSALLDLTDDQALSVLLEPYFTNGNYYPFSGNEGNPFVGLTGAPCIAKHMSFSNCGKASIQGKLWWYPNYAVQSPVEELVNSKQVDFRFGALYPMEGCNDGN